MDKDLRGAIDWKIRYEHERDFVIAWCKSEGVPVPESPYGTVKRPKGFLQSFHGKKFWEEFKRLGHTSCEVTDCKCVRS